MSEPRNGRKRSLLAQERSRDTRQAIIRAALELWSERGYAEGGDDPTAEYYFRSTLDNLNRADPFPEGAFSPVQLQIGYSLR